MVAEPAGLAVQRRGPDVVNAVAHQQLAALVEARGPARAAGAQREEARRLVGREPAVEEEAARVKTRRGVDQPLRDERRALQRAAAGDEAALHHAEEEAVVARLREALA